MFLILFPSKKIKETGVFSIFTMRNIRGTGVFESINKKERKNYALLYEIYS